jgi:hypothetical protein
MIIDFDNFDLKCLQNGKFIFNNKMLLFDPNNDDIVNIPSNIKYLNIIETTNKEYINLPLNIEFLHLSNKNKNIIQTNLPFLLKTITITLNKNNKYLINNNKICVPFGCELCYNFLPL